MTSPKSLLYVLFPLPSYASRGPQLSHVPHTWDYSLSALSHFSLSSLRTRLLSGVSSLFLNSQYSAWSNMNSNICGMNYLLYVRYNSVTLSLTIPSSQMLFPLCSYRTQVHYQFNLYLFLPIDCELLSKELCLHLPNYTRTVLGI